MKTTGFIENLETLAIADVVVGGGGPAGLAAALAAARQGAKVIILEQAGALGGMATLGLVPCMAYLFDGVNNTAAGICMEIVSEVCRRMGVAKVAPSWQPINAEIFKQVCDVMVTETGITVLFNQKIAAVAVTDGRLSSIAVAGPKGLKKVLGKVFVDGTGDAALAAFAGAGFECGNEAGETMSPSLCVQYAGVDWEKYYKSCAEGRDCRKIWRELLDNGTAPLPEYHFVGVFKTGRSTATGNLGHVYGINAIDEQDVSKGFIEGRKIARIIQTFFKDYVAGFENSELVNTASLLSVRETRRIKGDYKLVFDDYVCRASFADDIARYSYPVDIHSSSTDAEEQKKVEERMADTRYSQGENYGIPYRTLLPVGIENLLVAGRSISCDREMQSSLRVMPACFLTGQAAGTAAAMSLQSGGQVRKVDIGALRGRLRSTLNAYLP